MLPSSVPSVDLIGLLQRPEGKTLEFKRDLSLPEKVLHTLIAFANTAGIVDFVTRPFRSSCTR